MRFKKGFISLEAMIYVLICLIVLSILFLIINKNKYFSDDNNIKIYQSYDQLRYSLVKYSKVTKYTNEEITFNNEYHLKISDNKIFEYPGYLLYFDNINKPQFIYNNHNLILEFTYKDKLFKQVIFIEK